MAAVVYLFDTLVGLYLLVLVLRLLLQWSRADFRNPFARAIVQLTNPLILPLRRILPPVRQLDTASVVAVSVVVLLKVAALQLLLGLPLPPPLEWLRLAVLALAKLVLYLYLFAILLYWLLSMLAPDGSSAPLSLLYALCEPLLRQVRRLIPPLAGLDLSALWVMIAIQALLLLLP
jgi:YggT family protein